MIALVRPVPVLMYHSVARRPTAGTRALSVDPRHFAEQLDHLEREGFTTMTLEELRSARREATEIPERPVVLTFDDGYADFHEVVLPLLADHAATATLFVTTGWVADAGRQAAGTPLDRTVSWSQVDECAAAGIEIGAHSHSHAQLDQLGHSALRDELRRSKTLLEDRLGREVPHLAYPYGYSSARVRRAVYDAGYRQAASVANTAARATANPLAVPRLTIKRTTDIGTFARVVRGQHLPRIFWRERTLTAGYSLVRRSRYLATAVRTS
ncbi:polysaccharide deacetylase family protein [Actinomycetospora cinnamomea]|uniref:Polysaccharide deacetylase n=1 Tax=Actinomycetospora cinnamomea TaxID=663609 RepID=A0A2U1EXE1_9PSEU|nr:polysaccharide deacetylase family protein [Actinomycetospora cinnamomea]PVZ04592.1 polysaccharide deacetylase [Actinomycetospora cinnamomea]